MCQIGKDSKTVPFLGGGGGSDLDKKISLVSWATVCSDKSKGGIGIKSFSKMNKALLCKWSGWFANDRNALWRKVISCKFGESVGGLHNAWKLEEMIRFLQTLHDQNFHPTGEDKLLLKNVKEKGFSVKIMYKGFDISPTFDFPYRLVWNPVVPSKIGVFAWEAAWGKVLTLDQLKRRGMTFANRCFMCEEEEETIDHLLTHCNSAKMLWDFFCQLSGLVGFSRIRFFTPF